MGMGSTSTVNFYLAVLTTSVLKLLFLKSYRSTDFEVHRNWLAITHSLPLQKWYYDETSEWTLDYPPFFAYFEWILSHAAKLLDPEMLDVKNLNYASSMTILFQKSSVVVIDFVLAYGVQECSKAVHNVFYSKMQSEDVLMKLFALIFINGGLLMVDHIHFQYNGFLFGILLLSMGRIVEGKGYQGALLFAALLNFKHIFLYVAPAFGVFLFRKYCIRIGGPLWRLIDLGNLLRFGGIVVFVFSLSLGPFYQHFPQILKRLFPFGRGLCHAYWAPNFWAAYNTLDLILNYGLKKGKSGITSGIVGESSLAVLPQVQPIHTFVLTLLLMLPSLYKLWKSPTEKSFIYAVLLTAWTSFMFGYHVHEKAILNVIIPFCLISFLQPKWFLLTLISGTVSLFPLLYTNFEIILKALLSIFHITLCSAILSPSLRWFEIAYVIGFVPLYVLENLGSTFLPNLPFLPLLVVSDYCFVGILYCYLGVYWEFMNQINSESERSINKTPSKRKLQSISPSSRVLRERKVK